MGCGTCSSGGGCSCGGGGAPGGYSPCGDGCPSVQVFDWLPTTTTDSAHYDLVEVAFKGRRKNIYRNTRGLSIYAGDQIVVGVKRGIDFGRVTMTGELVRLRASRSKDFQNVIRVASPRDINRHKANGEAETEALHAARRAVERRRMPMKMVDVEWQFDRKRITFFFTAEKRVDFRKILGDFAHQYRARIDMQRIGARDETARIGGVGACGRELCCSTWMHKIPPVAKNAWKKQNLAYNPVRLNGQCGQLKCCLNYELEQYMTALKDFPSLKTRIITGYGAGKIDKLDIFRRRIGIRHSDGTLEDKSLESVQAILANVAPQHDPTPRPRDP